MANFDDRVDLGSDGTVHECSDRYDQVSSTFFLSFFLFLLEAKPPFVPNSTSGELEGQSEELTMEMPDLKKKQGLVSNARRRSKGKRRGLGSRPYRLRCFAKRDLRRSTRGSRLESRGSRRDRLSCSPCTRGSKLSCVSFNSSCGSCRADENDLTFKIEKPEAVDHEYNE